MARYRYDPNQSFSGKTDVGGSRSIDQLLGTARPWRTKVGGRMTGPCPVCGCPRAWGECPLNHKTLVPKVSRSRP